jgi:hypothetical protein
MNQSSDKGKATQRMRGFGFLLTLCIALGAFIGCDRPPEAQITESDDMKRAIAQLKGTYTWRGDLDRYDYSAKVKLDEIVSAKPPEYAVGNLIACLDDISPSASVLDAKTVPIGIICYEGLSLLAYYEPTEPNGDVSAHWPGLISPKASPDEMRNAKTAWQKAHERKLLIFQ